MPNGIQEYYDKTAKEWAERGYTEESEIPSFREFTALLPPGGRVLDLCCGTGYDCQRFCSLGFEVVGLDLSEECLRIARKHNPGLPFYQGDMLEDYSHIGPVDGISVFAGLVHIENPDLPTAFARMAQVLRPGGLLLAAVREGSGKIDSLSISEIDGQTYDRNFIGHTLADLTAAMGPEFSYLQELSSDMSVWHAYLFRRK